MKPLEGLHSCICMGASIGMAHGISKALREKGKGRVIGVLGDSTFVHSGIPSLLNTAYNRSDVVIIIADNSTTAMTGMQHHPGTGSTLQGRNTVALDYETLARSLGIESIRVIDPYDLKNTRAVMKEELARSGPSLVISRAPCVLLTSKTQLNRKSFRVDSDKCTGCKVCLGLGCPPISWRRFPEGSGRNVPGKTRIQEGMAAIDSAFCTGCTLCEQLCSFKAIVESGEEVQES